MQNKSKWENSFFKSILSVPPTTLNSSILKIYVKATWFFIRILTRLSLLVNSDSICFQTDVNWVAHSWVEFYKGHLQTEVSAALHSYKEFIISLEKIPWTPGVLCSSFTSILIHLWYDCICSFIHSFIHYLLNAFFCSRNYLGTWQCILFSFLSHPIWRWYC